MRALPDLRLGRVASTVRATFRRLSLEMAGFLLRVILLPLGDYSGIDLTFAILATNALHAVTMLFNAQRYRSGDEKILEREIAKDIERPRGN